MLPGWRPEIIVLCCHAQFTSFALTHKNDENPESKYKTNKIARRRDAGARQAETS
jgi:hypothetical protein